MDRRLTSVLRPSPAWALALAVAAGLASPARGQDLPGMGSLPAQAPPNPGPVEPQPEPKAVDTPTAPVRDHALRRSGEGVSPLPPALRRGDGVVQAAGGGVEEIPDGFNTDFARVPVGRQALGLSAEVIAPEILNVGQTRIVKIVVRNTGVADASAVRVSYHIPPELDYQPDAQPKPAAVDKEQGKLTWQLKTLAAGSEQVIAVKVKPNKIGSIDHGAAVSLIVGARSHSTIQQPQLKVEQVVTPAKVLKGQRAEFRITVRNPGTGPARDVTIQAKLGPGLRANGDETVEQTLPVIQPGEAVQLDPLVVDTIAAGSQASRVTAYCEDVTGKIDPAEATVEVLYPDLKVVLKGPETRYTDTTADYTVTVQNKGTAPARNVRVNVILPASGGALTKPLPPEAEWNRATQKLTWVIPVIEPAPRGSDRPGEVSATFHVRLNGIGNYPVVAEARSGDLFSKEKITTDVSGMADIDLDVTERKRVLDVGDVTIFDVTIKNRGTKAAEDLDVTAVLTNVDVDRVAGIDESAEANFDPQSGLLRFPILKSLAPGKEQVLNIRVRATKPGAATCKVKVDHKDVKGIDAGLEAVASARVTNTRR